MKGEIANPRRKALTGESDCRETTDAVEQGDKRGQDSDIFQPLSPDAPKQIAFFCFVITWFEHFLAVNVGCEISHQFF
jgi:hypothetical protein